MKATILFAEDDRELQQLVARQLNEEGYAVTTADNGEEAVSYVGRERFDMALLDIHMPMRDGLAVLSAIRAQHPQTRVVMLTGVDDLSVALEAMKRGADDYITKPFSFDNLLSCIARVLDR